ncbi:hypothetical protein GCM10023091_14940 [Ravibacter arvi]|uniref:DUF1684 domain-containing protein n=1 Tax=Ravibacter arvi TaxID=2051041 RepID=A0ABP8LUR2_9BACT
MTRFFAGLHVITAFICCAAVTGTVQAQNRKAEIESFRKKQQATLTELEDSPLHPEDTASITYFPPEEDFAVMARIELLRGEKPFEMPAFDGSTKTFVRYAILHFQLKGKPHRLTAFRSGFGALAALQPTYFVPFRDETNAATTYGGGRYMDVAIPPGAENILLDFNKAYNPWCAYADGFRCPIPPAENTISQAVEAGERNYRGTRRSRNSAQH